MAVIDKGEEFILGPTLEYKDFYKILTIMTLACSGNLTNL